MKNIFKKIFVILFVISLIPINVRAEFKILIYGDSLCAGYGVANSDSFSSQLQKKLKENGYNDVVLINKSRSGETTAGGLKRLPAVLNSVKPNAIILELGINDVFRGKSITSIQNNFVKMIDLLNEKNISVLLVGMKAPPYTEISYQHAFSKMYETLAKQHHFILYPFFMDGLIDIIGEGYQPKQEYILSDKIHPNKNGILLMVNNIFPVLKTFLQKNNIYPSY